MKKQIFDLIRGVLGKLTQSQVDVLDRALNEIGVAEDSAKTISTNGTKLIASFEGLELTAYLCPAKVWTIGLGTTVYSNGQPVKKGDTCTKEQALQYKAHDLRRFENCVNSAVKVSINQNQFDALVSLAYNIGEKAFSNSTLVKKLNTGDYQGAADQFSAWNKSKGKVLNGLVNRRAAERTLFLNP